MGCYNEKSAFLILSILVLNENLGLLVKLGQIKAITFNLWKFMMISYSYATSMHTQVYEIIWCSEKQ